MTSNLQSAQTQKIETPRPTMRVYAPRVDVVETDDALTLYADLPGVKQEDVSLTCKDGELILHASCPPRHVGRKLLYAEYGIRDFHRTFKVTDKVDTGGIEASLKDGVLTVRVPKAESVRTKRVTVNGG
ncbi:Hsp20/alpha crystallin family protein [Fimbriiglobus ruber]|uniref:Molecular chaperone (Small heat shock protein) n=1 Tax=Fimbriiglobus ruber TaxID=1908690 RepID=A0A225DDG9_9BACT|nr:Hsp20/alpha crystallin family protein [Fimbriiglobus ruber]OWK35199.1 Molecular chaperone (small heat shock protein) [Fimbriiglobus ruber]